MSKLVQHRFPTFQPSLDQFPQTRFQGSKLKLLNWIRSNVEGLDFHTVLDAFGGTGAVSYLFKTLGKQVTYNDLLRFNYYIGLALIENDGVILTEDDVEFLLTRHPEIEYPTFIQDTFQNIYYTDEENRWLDVVVTNIRQLNEQGEEKYKKALAYFALFQAAIIKRPYNLFHRKNLYLRIANVDRSFGNKTTWDTPFEEWFVQFVDEANEAVFDNGQETKAINYDALEVSGQYDLVYVDTPYISSKGTGVDYLDFYHFLEGIVYYDGWSKRINYNTKHRKLKHEKSIWADKNHIHQAFDRLFARFQDSILVVSYRERGIPTKEELLDLLRKYKGSNVREAEEKDYKYVLSNRKAKELLLIAP